MRGPDSYLLSLTKHCCQYMSNWRQWYFLLLMQILYVQYGKIKKAPGPVFFFISRLLLGVSSDYAGQEDDKAEHRQGQGINNHFLCSWRNYSLSLWLFWTLVHLDRSFFNECAHFCQMPDRFPASANMWSWWRHQMETFSAFLVHCARN